MVKQVIHYEGDLHCSARHEPSGAVMTTDAPVDNMGRGETFSPTDLTATALATCILTTIAIVGKKMGIELGPSTAEIEKHMTKKPPRRIERLVCHVTLSGVDDPALRAKLEAAADHCPVHLSLHPDVVQDISISWK